MAECLCQYVCNIVYRQDPTDLQFSSLYLMLHPVKFYVEVFGVGVPYTILGQIGGGVIVIEYWYGHTFLWVRLEQPKFLEQLPQKDSFLCCTMQSGVLSVARRICGINLLL